MRYERNDSAATGKVLRTPRFWLAPMVVVGIVMALLATLYLGSILNPEKNLHDFPIALVNQDEGETVPGPNGDQRQNFGDQIADAMAEGIPADKVDLRRIGISEAQGLLSKGSIYGAIIIPSDFTKRLVILGQASVVPGEVERPAITVNTNPRVGTFATGIVTSIADQALSKVNATVGQKLRAQVDEALKAGPPTPIAGASALTLSEPVEIHTVPFRPLPDGTGNGLSAFYYTLLLLLAGFTGAMIVSNLVDSMLGFAPTEYGPWYITRESVGVSRFQTLLVKWAIMVILGLLLSAMYIGIAKWLGMPIDNGLLLWEFGAFAIAAVGVTASSIIATFGSAGLLVNLIVFVVLGLPSSGGTIPIEAMPHAYEWLARFIPMRQVFVGVHSILYFDGNFDSGLLEAFWMTLLGLGIGPVLGFVVTRIYDRKGFTRGNTPAAV
ncbi:DUF3533 domain-containing protein [Antrihabitans cavernicola]|uniref:DUF3533 domain-containing protein n=1 Tax=Antrihabitans cavernicola TaxID=2495913 RepID=A0A5A7S8R7_9NOCA|nr:DUF3533 domain-containing protein [Spelaeibacter cavernicola]KAA0021874.1 DUF3533 domain-containing protein [Spelaeibacter cavernicola]